MEQLFEVTSHYTYEELKRYNRFYRIRKVYPKMLVFLLLMAAPAIKIILSGYQKMGLAIIIGLLLGTIGYVVFNAVRLPKALKNMPMFDKIVTVRFYENFITAEFDSNRVEYDHARIKRIYETNDNFYIDARSFGSIIIVKQNCSEQLSEYIRELDPVKKKIQEMTDGKF